MRTPLKFELALIPNKINCTSPSVLQIGQCEAVPILVKMLQNAKGNEERLNACNTLWTLAFDEENRQMIRSDDYALFELRKLLTTSEDSEIKRAAAGALWECEGKEKHAEEKQQTVTLEQISGSYSPKQSVSAIASQMM